MRRRMLAAFLLAWFSITAAGLTVVHAQRAPAATKEDVAALQAKLDELRRATVQIPTLAAAVTELSERLAVLKQELDKIHAEHQAAPHVVERLDDVTQKLESAARQLESLRTRLANWEQAPVRGSGSGVTYKGGFRWTTADGQYGLKLSGYAQARYELGIADGDIDTATLRLRRARVAMAGHLGERLRYKVVLSAIKTKAALDYYLDYQVRGPLTVRVGQYKTPFTRTFLTSSTRQVFLEVPEALSGLLYDRDVQAGVHGYAGGDRLWYYAGIGNGAGPNERNDNLEVNVTVRADAVAVGERFAYGYGDTARTNAPALMIGAGLVHDLVPMSATVSDISVNTDVDANGEADNARLISASADAVFRYRGLEAAFEGVVRHEEFGDILLHPDNAELGAAIGDRRTHWGASGQLTYYFPRHVLVGARVGWGQLSFLGVGGRGSSLPAGDSLWEVDGVIALMRPGAVPPVSLRYSMRRFTPGSLREQQVIIETMLSY